MKDDGAPGRLPPVTEVQLLRAAACDWRLSRGDVGVFAVILKHCNGNGEAWPGPTRISDQADLAVANVKASLRRLEEHWYIAVVRPGPRKKNSYIVLDSPDVPPRPPRKKAQPSQLGMRTGLADEATGYADRSATGYADRSATRYADRPQLGMPAGHEGTSELTSEIAFELTGAARPGVMKEKRGQEEQKKSGEYQRQVDWIRHQVHLGMIDEAEGAEQLRALQDPGGEGQKSRAFSFLTGRPGDLSRSRN